MPDGPEASEEIEDLPRYTDLDAAHERFKDVMSVFVRCASADDLNRKSWLAAATLSVDYGLTDLYEGVNRELEAERRAVELRSKLVVVPKARAGRNETS